MMLLLRRNIVGHLRNLRLADGECAVTTLPIESVHAIRFHPFRAFAFYIADQFADVDSAKRNQNVNVVRHTSGDDHATFVVRDDAGDVGIQSWLDLRRDQRAAVFGRENNVDEDLDDGLRHPGMIANVRRLQRRFGFLDRLPRVAAVALTLGFIGLSPLATEDLHIWGLRLSL